MDNQEDVQLAVYPHRFRRRFSHTWLDRGGTEGDLMELNGWTSPQMLRLYGASARSARAAPRRLRPHHGRPVMTPARTPHPAAGSGSRMRPAMLIAHAQVTA